MHAPLADNEGTVGNGSYAPAVLIVPKSTLEREDLQQAIEDVRSHGFDLEIQATDSPDDTRRLIKDFAFADEHTLIAGGGDGMLNVFAQAIDAFDLRGCTLGILPLGTGNDFATAAGIPDTDLETALRIAIAGPPYPVDLAYVNGTPFFNMVTIGRTAEFSTEADPQIKERFGKWAYIFSAVKKIGESQCSTVHVQAGDLNWSGSVFGVMVGNGRQAGGGFCMSQDAVVDDGKLNGLVIPEMSAREAAALAYDLKRDAAKLKLDELPVFESSTAKLTFENAQTMQIDGEVNEARTFEFSVDPKRVKIRLPRMTPLISNWSDG